MGLPRGAGLGTKRSSRHSGAWSKAGRHESSRAHCFTVVVVLAILTQSPSTVQPQVAGGFANGSTALISPSVEATWMTNGGRLDLVVLWRGSPGWSQRLPSKTDYDGSRVTLLRGTTRLTLDYNRRLGIAVVQGSTIRLSSSNVVFVDTVDSVRGPVVVRVGQVTATMRGSPAQIGPILANSEEIRTYLRCRVLPREPGLRRLLERKCLTTIGAE
jgi:hypothetical protein